MSEDLAALRDELHALLAGRAMQFGDFVLTSGRRSDYYVDGKQVTLDGRGLYLVSRLALERCRSLDLGPYFDLKVASQIATAHGKTANDVATALKNAAHARIDQAVTAGKLTADQATQQKTQIDQRIDQQINQVTPQRGG